VALIIPRWTDREQRESQGVPFRSFTMGGAFLAAGYEVVFFDQEPDLDRTDRFPQLIRELDDCRAAFVWMNESYPSNQFANARMLTIAVKQACPTLPVVIGGEMVTICPPEFFDVDGPMDFILRGYGEAAGIRLLEHFANGSEPIDVSGLIWRDDGGVRHANPITAMAEFRPEYLELYRRLDLSCYVQTGGVFGNDQPTLSVAPGRGCTKGCPFCCWSNHSSKILGGQETFDLLAFLHDRYGVKQFHIGELDFFMSRQRALELATLIHEHRPDIGWYALGSPIDLIKLSDADWDQLRDGGLLKVEMGSEAGSTSVLRSIGKKHTAEDIFTISKKMLDRGIVPMNNFLFGFPGETHLDRAATLRLIDRLIEVGAHRNHFTYRHYQPVWGTPVGDAALAHAPDRPRRVDPWLAERHLFAEENSRTMPWLPIDDERELKRLINYDLPLATSQLVIASPWRRVVYRALRTRAQRSLRTGGRRRRMDRWIYDHVVSNQLDRTFIP